MQLSTLLKMTDRFGGFWKFLLLNLRGGQFIGGIISFSVYAWVMGLLRHRHLATPMSDESAEGLAAFVMVYTFVSVPAMWFLFGKLWFDYVLLLLDSIAMASSIGIAVLSKGATMNCKGLFLSDAEKAMLGTDLGNRACKLQKIAFATGVSNSIMFAITLLIQVYLISKRYKTRGMVTSNLEEQSDLESSVKTSAEVPAMGPK